MDFHDAADSSAAVTEVDQPTVSEPTSAARSQAGVVENNNEAGYRLRESSRDGPRDVGLSTESASKKESDRQSGANKKSTDTNENKLVEVDKTVAHNRDEQKGTSNHVNDVGDKKKRSKTCELV
jgi:hypothetical protein